MKGLGGYLGAPGWKHKHQLVLQLYIHIIYSYSNPSDGLHESLIGHLSKQNQKQKEMRFSRDSSKQNCNYKERVTRDEYLLCAVMSRCRLHCEWLLKTACLTGHKASAFLHCSLPTNGLPPKCSFLPNSFCLSSQGFTMFTILIVPFTFLWEFSNNNMHSVAAKMSGWWLPTAWRGHNPQNMNNNWPCPRPPQPPWPHSRHGCTGP